ncbi:PCI-domain-containing protein [Tilletiopsis washingtonensis]|uniref:PCI-domain-containing protein n=1 Tax=Tilletiopsis washingtonensis TaxID=58919 RepID=A0A316YZR7_9BASI|nr:PCI-domain-containing protein [Tilletiopsis washingtonensis]PWN94947.1 PCI-domain-containing protein [Tilletiopsis washingtonensis]
MAPAATLAAADAARKAGNADEAVQICTQILAGSSDTDEALREHEGALTRLAGLYRDASDADALAALVRDSRTFMGKLPKAKTAKLIRSLIDHFDPLAAASPEARSTQVAVTRESIEWAREERRVFLRQSLESRLIGLYFDQAAYRAALPLIDSLLKELKRLDDKMVLTEVHLLESRVLHALKNMPRAKAALTSARTAANAIYCPPLLQAQLDLQSGVLHAEDKDYTTAYSYFFETLEGLSAAEDSRAPLALKYMLLCKIMLNLPDDVAALVDGKMASKYGGRDVGAMKAVAEAHEKRDLQAFEEALRSYKEELSNDPIIRTHLAALYDTLLEQNLLRLIEPYSRVEIEHVAGLVRQPVREVEQKLSQMILDKVLAGILDQGAGCLIVYDDAPPDATYAATLETLRHVGNVVDSLAAKAKALS